MARADQIAGFIAKFDPVMAKLIRSARAAMRRRLPTAHELVYDNYNFFVMGYSSSDRASDCIVSLAAYAKGLRLFFAQGAKLNDPMEILEGSGKQVRSIRVTSAADLVRPEVEALIEEAIRRAVTPLPNTGRGSTIVKSIAAKQRPRR